MTLILDEAQWMKAKEDLMKEFRVVVVEEVIRKAYLRGRQDVLFEFQTTQAAIEKLMEKEREKK